MPNLERFKTKFNSIVSEKAGTIIEGNKAFLERNRNTLKMYSKEPNILLEQSMLLEELRKKGIIEMLEYVAEVKLPPLQEKVPYTVYNSSRVPLLVGECSAEYVTGAAIARPHKLKKLDRLGRGVDIYFFKGILVNGKLREGEIRMQVWYGPGIHGNVLYVKSGLDYSEPYFQDEITAKNLDEIGDAISCAMVNGDNSLYPHRNIYFSGLGELLVPQQ